MIDDVLLRHRPECRLPLLANLRAREEWANSWPKYCRACEGWGLQDGSDPSVGISGNDPCARCAEKGTCPRCATRYAFIRLEQVSLMGVPSFCDISPRTLRKLVEWRVEYLLGNEVDHVSTEFTETANRLAEQILDLIVTAHDGGGGCRVCGFDYGPGDSMPPPYECGCGESDDDSPVRGAARCPKCRRESVETIDGVFAPHDDEEGRPCEGAIYYFITGGTDSEIYRVGLSLPAGSFSWYADIKASSPLHAVALMLNRVASDYTPLDILSVLKVSAESEGEWLVDARLWHRRLQVRHGARRQPFVEPDVTEIDAPGDEAAAATTGRARES